MPDYAGDASLNPDNLSVIVAMHWAQPLKRVFGIEIERCDQCGGAVKIIASIEDPEVIAAILEYLGLDRSEDSHPRLPAARAAPRGRLDPFDSADSP